MSTYHTMDFIRVIFFSIQTHLISSGPFSRAPWSILTLRRNSSQGWFLCDSSRDFLNGIVRTLAMFLDFNLKLVFVLYFCINAIESKEDIFDPIDRLIQGESPPTISQIVGFSTFLFQIALRLLIAFLD